MATSRRKFLADTSLGLMGAAAGCKSKRQEPAAAPAAASTASGAGPDVSSATFADAEKLVRVQLANAERAQAAKDWRNSMAPLYERRSGPNKVDLEPTLAPWSHWSATLTGHTAGPARNRFVRGNLEPCPLPASDEDIAFAPLTKLSYWVKERKLSSERLTTLYLDRLQRFDPKLHCVIILLRDPALTQARQADKEIAAGRYRGPLHGIPWGAKDLLDTAGVPTTYGAEPFRNRVPKTDAVVVERLNQAGAVLAAKLSMGALALNDVLVRRPDDESLADRGRLVGLERGSGRCDGGRAGRLLDRQ